MIKIENVVTPSPEQWISVIRGLRNPMNSWEKSDSSILGGVPCEDCKNNYEYNPDCSNCGEFVFGREDMKLMHKLCASGTDHRKFMRMLPVVVDVTAPLYWWKEFDTYKVGTVANSCSTMHKIHSKEFTFDDFSHEHLIEAAKCYLRDIIEALNGLRDAYNDFENMPDGYYSGDGISSKKDIWWQIIQLLPSSYNQRRTVFLNFEVLINIYRARKDHKLDEWRDFCRWIETIPHFVEIAGCKDV